MPSPLDASRQIPALYLNVISINKDAADGAEIKTENLLLKNVHPVDKEVKVGEMFNSAVSYTLNKTIDPIVKSEMDKTAEQLSSLPYKMEIKLLDRNNPEQPVFEVKAVDSLGQIRIFNAQGEIRNGSLSIISAQEQNLANAPVIPLSDVANKIDNFLLPANAGEKVPLTPNNLFRLNLRENLLLDKSDSVAWQERKDKALDFFGLKDTGFNPATCFAPSSTPLTAECRNYVAAK